MFKQLFLFLSISCLLLSCDHQVKPQTNHENHSDSHSGSAPSDSENHR